MLPIYRLMNLSVSVALLSRLINQLPALTIFIINYKQSVNLFRNRSFLIPMYIGISFFSHWLLGYTRYMRSTIPPHKVLRCIDLFHLRSLLQTLTSSIFHYCYKNFLLSYLKKKKHTVTCSNIL